MRPFLDPNPGHDLQGDDQFRHKVTNCYIELEYPANGFYLVVYLFPINNFTLGVATSFENSLDGIERYLADEYSLQTFAETWPLTANLLANGIRDQYSQGALIRIPDYDTGDMKWFVATMVGNLNLQDWESFFSERTREAMQLVVGLSLQLLDELTTRQPDILTDFGRRILGGLGGFAASVSRLTWRTLLQGEWDTGDPTEGIA